MSMLTLFLMVLQGICFLIWASLSFRAIFQIRAIAVGQTDRLFPSPLSFLRAAAVWLRDPANRGVQVLWGAALVAVVMPSVLIAVTAPLVE